MKVSSAGELAALELDVDSSMNLAGDIAVRSVEEETTGAGQGGLEICHLVKCRYRIGRHHLSRRNVLPLSLALRLGLLTQQDSSTKLRKGNVVWLGFLSRCSAN
jgi:hypothetical protein